jgi:hypothetical protein
MHVRKRKQAPAHCIFQEWTAHRQRFNIARRAYMASSFKIPSGVSRNVGRQGSTLYNFAGDAGKQQIQHTAAAGQEGVRVPGLRHSAPAYIFQRKAIALNNSHPGIVVPKYSGRQQSRHAAAHYDHVFHILPLAV